VINSPIVLDKVLSIVEIDGSTIESKRRALLRKIDFNTRGTLVVLSTEDQEPTRAQAANRAIIDAWIEASKPRPDSKAILEEQLALVDTQLQAVTTLLTRLATETPKLVIPGMQNELASSLASLESSKTSLTTRKAELQRALLGTSRDVIVVPPTLPEEPSFPRKGIIGILTGIVTLFVVLVAILIKGAVQLAKGDAATSRDVDRIRKAFRFWGGTRK